MKQGEENSGVIMRQNFRMKYGGYMTYVFKEA